MLGIGLAINKGGLPVWNPRALYAAGEQGAWYDPSDFSTLYQDSAGTTPVTAVGQPVGLVLDKRFGLALGSEKLVRPTTVPSGVVDNGDGSFTAPAPLTSDALIYYAALLTVGKAYRIEAQVTASNGGGSVQAASAPDYVNFDSSAGSKIAFNYAPTSTGNFNWVLKAGFSGTIKPISVRELPGNHASQSTTTARPLYQSGPRRVAYDGVDDKLTTKFASTLGGNCTVARSIPGTGAQILTGQTVGTTFDGTVTNCGLVIINRALTAAETSRLSGWLNARAGL